MWFVSFVWLMNDINKIDQTNRMFIELLVGHCYNAFSRPL